MTFTDKEYEPKIPDVQLLLKKRKLAVETHMQAWAWSGGAERWLHPFDWADRRSPHHS